MTATRVLFRLELADALRSRWMLFTGAVYAFLFGVFIWLGLRESSVLGFTGLSRVVINVSSAVVLAIPLVALVATSQTIVRARSSCFFELVLTQPVRRADWLWAIVASRFVVVVGPLLVMLVAAVVVGTANGGTDAALLPAAFRSLSVSAALAWAFIGVGFWISARSRTAERATVFALVTWVVASSLHDFALIGALLRWRVTPAAVFTLAAANPVEAARIAVLGAVDPDLAVLGPVGFWIANTLGANGALAVGIAWPLAVGAFALWRAERALVTSDLVG